MPAILLIAALLLNSQPGDTLTSASVVSYWKNPSEATGAVSSFRMEELEGKGVSSPRDLSLEVPNLHIPDYGSAMTSSIYLRGFGSRIDNPVMGLYIDDIPIIDKNNYDFSFMDIRRADMLRGPQGTLFGRNSLAGVLALQTLSPSVRQGFRARVEGGSFGTVKAGLSLYKGPVGVTLQFTHRNGWYTNTYDGSKCDGGEDLALRLRYEHRFSGGLLLEEIFSASALYQRGYPYRKYEDGNLLPVNYNTPSGYKRISVMNGLKLSFPGEKLDIRSITSVQILLDKMYMDNDFTPAAIFMLSQSQNQVALTQELIIRPRKKKKYWDSVTGLFGMLRNNLMSAPVTFYEDGIQDLILYNANAHMPDFMGTLHFVENSFTISDEFKLFYGGTAIYHESWFTLGEWRLTAGLRLDYEGQRMAYDSRASIRFYYIPALPTPNPCNTTYKGAITNHYLQLLPKVAASRKIGDFKINTSVTKGYKAGGFNTQIFSDILQNQMMTDLMDMVGVQMDGAAEVSARSTTYKPEECWNFELGGSYSGKNLSASVTGFYIDCLRQQITVFPPGKTTGRMMANAGRSFSAGAEAEVRYTGERLFVTAAYGFTEARFVSFNDGNSDYAGKHIPYSPGQTALVHARYDIPIKSSTLRLGINWRGTGRIWWDEANTLSQEFVGLLGASISFSRPRWTAYVRGENILNREYSTFYFKSMGNSFFQQARPRSIVGGITIDI